MDDNIKVGCSLVLLKMCQMSQEEANNIDTSNLVEKSPFFYTPDFFPYQSLFQLLLKLTTIAGKH